MVVGYIFIIVAIALFLFKLYVSFDTEGGAVGMTPTMDGVIFPPFFGTFGVLWITSWRWYVLLLIWVGATLFAWCAIGLAGILGAKRGR